MKRGSRIFVVLTIAIIAAVFVFGKWGSYGPDTFKSDTIGVLRVEGPITDVRWHMDKVHDLMKNDRVKGVVLRVESPGGVIAPTQELYTELKRLGGEKPVVASMGSIAASGGYYLSCAADWIVANPGTITGSIGVIMQFSNTEDLFKKLGISTRTIKSGRFKDTGNPMRPMTKEEMKLLQDMVLDTYEQFVEAVLEGRPVKESEVRPYFDGRILTGRQAYELGLVDELGNLNTALEKASRMAGLSEVPEDILEPERERPGIIPLLFGDAFARAVARLSDSIRDQADDRRLQLWRAF